MNCINYSWSCLLHSANLFPHISNREEISQGKARRAQRPFATRFRARLYSWANASTHYAYAYNRAYDYDVHRHHRRRRLRLRGHEVNPEARDESRDTVSSRCITRRGTQADSLTHTSWYLLSQTEIKIMRVYIQHRPPVTSAPQSIRFAWWCMKRIRRTSREDTYLGVDAANVAHINPFASTVESRLSERFNGMFDHSHYAQSNIQFCHQFIREEIFIS